MKIFCLHNGTGSRFYRLIPQLKDLQAHGHQVILEKHDDPYALQHIEWADVVILQMVLSPEYIKHAKKHKKKVIFECDDLIHVVPPTHYEYANTRGVKNRLRWWKRLYQNISKCDGFIATNEALVEKYGWMAKKSLVFPNYCDLAHWLKEYKKNTSGTIRLLWAGSTSHTGDLKMIKPVLKRILDKYPQVRFIYIGTGGVRTDDLNAKFIYGEDLFDGLPDNREIILPMTANLYPYTLAGLLADIAIAPLEKNYFNGFKSACKFLEYGVNKIPGVYSEWFYRQAVKDGDTGFLADTDEEWVEKLSRLIEDQTLRKQIGQKAYEHVVNNQNIDDKMQSWRVFVEKI